MDVIKNNEYIKWLSDNFDIKVTEENKEYFHGVISTDNCQGNYCSNVLAFKGDPLISFMVCDRNMDDINLTSDRKLTDFTSEKEKYISDDKFAKIFDYYQMSKFTNHNTSNEIGKKVKSSCIEALIYAVYKSFNIDKAWEVFKKCCEVIEK